MKTRSLIFRLLTLFLVLSFPIGIGCNTGGGSLTVDTGDGSQKAVPAGGSKTKVPWTGTAQLGTPLFDEPSAIATDAAGNVYIAGGSSGDIDNCGCMSRMDGIVVKYGPSGKMEWVVEIEEDAWIYARGIAVPPHRKFVYVTGETDADLTSTGSAHGRMDIFLYRIGSSGEKVLMAQEGTPDDDYARAVAADSDGNAYIAGDTFGNLYGSLNSGTRDAFVMKLNPKGKREWSVQFGSTDIDTASGIALDAMGNAYVVGHTFGSLGSDTNLGPGRSDVFLAKVAPGGVLEWVKLLGTPFSDIGTSVAVDSSGYVFVSGTTGGRLGSGINAGLTDAFVAKFSPDGTRVWVSLIGTTEEESGYAVTTDAAGFVYLAGQTGGALGGTSSGLRDSFLACLAGGTGNNVWIRQSGTDRDDGAHAVAVNVDGDLFVVGDTFGGMDGNTNRGSCDIFVAKYDHLGNEF